MRQRLRSCLTNPLLLGLAAVCYVAGCWYATTRDPDIKMWSRFSPDMLLFAPNGALLVVSDGFSGEFYSVPAYERIKRIDFVPPGGSWGPRSTWNPDLTLVAWVDREDTGVVVWDVQRNMQSYRLSSDAPGLVERERHVQDNLTVISGRAGPEAITALAWSRDSRYLAIGRHNGRVQIWEPAADRITELIAPPPGSGGSTASCLAFSPDGSLFTATDSRTHRLALFNLPDFSRRASVQTSVRGDCEKLYFHAQSRTAVVIPWGWPEVQVWDLQSQTEQVVVDNWSGPVAWHPQQELLAIGIEGRILLWRSNAPLLTLGDLGDEYVQGLAFSPDGQDLLVSSSDGNIRVWPLAERAPSMLR